jgi:hypothetical protein
MVAFIALGFLLAISVVVILVSAYLNQNMKGHEPTDETLEQFFQKRAFARIAVIEDFWREAAAREVTLTPLVGLYLSSLNDLRGNVPRITGEVSRFIEEINEAHYQERMDELDRELFKREQNFGKSLWNAIRESWWLVSLERRRGKVADIESALSSGVIYRGFRDIDQILGNKGYLTDPPQFIRKNNYSEIISGELANATRKSFRRPKRQIRKFMVLFSTRYAWHFVMRNLVYALVTAAAIPFVTESVIQAGDLKIYDVTGLKIMGVLFILSAVGIKVYEKVFGPRWRERHRRAIRSAAIKLYFSLVDYAIERAPLDAAQVLSDKKKMREVFTPQ